MARKVMLNYLELAYSPINNYMFSLIKFDEHFRHLTQSSTIYIITQRSELTMNNLNFLSGQNGQLICQFEIRQKGNPSILNCNFPIYQQNLAKDITREIKFHFEYSLPKPIPLPNTFPQHNIVNLLFTYHDDSFIGWISPENFIQNYLNGAIDGDIKGPINDFIKYKVHYVGKATEQNVWKRLTGHSALQEILSLEYPFHFGTLPTHEITILFFKIRDAMTVHSISSGDEVTDDIIDAVLGVNQPTEKTVSLDAEKALINAMQPRYNKEFYSSYPISKDGLHSLNLDAYSYRIHSQVTLLYDDGEIEGSSNPLAADAIIVEKGHRLKVIKGNQTGEQIK